MFSTHMRHIWQMILLSFLLGFVFYQLGHDQISVHDRLALVYCTVAFGALRILLLTVERFESERKQVS